MDMKPDEIVVRYKQAKKKSEQLKILADLNACTVDEIIDVLCEHGEYQRNYFNKAKIALKQQSESAKVPYKKPEIIPEPPKPVATPEPVKEQKQTIDSALNVLRAEIADINRQQYELDMRKAEIYQKISNALDVLKGW